MFRFRFVHIPFSSRAYFVSGRDHCFNDDAGFGTRKTFAGSAQGKAKEGDRVEKKGGKGTKKRKEEEQQQQKNKVEGKET